MSELSRALNTPSSDSLDSLERAQWGDITKGVANLNLKVDDDTKPPPPTEAAPIDSIVGGGNDPREMALNCKIVGLKHKIKTLTKENKDLKREIGDMKPPTESASPPTKNIKGNRKIVVAHLYGKLLFKIPDGLDLDDGTMVAEWYVRYDELFITYADGTEATIESGMEHEPNNKSPKATIESAEDNCFEYSDDDGA